jgi:hypothetical protein
LELLDFHELVCCGGGEGHEGVHAEEDGERDAHDPGKSVQKEEREIDQACGGESEGGVRPV